MRRLFLSAISIFFFTQVYCQSQKLSNEFKRLSWLEGTWIRMYAKPGRNSNERWIRISGTEWQGFGLSMKGQDTAVLEKLKLIIKDDSIYYVADVPENNQPVYFKLTEISENAYTCENVEHDFPKKIIYQRDGKKLKATISGNGTSIDYWFEKIR